MSNTRHRILFISPQPFFQWRGSPIRVRFVLQALSELGYQVDLLTLPFGEDVELPNVRIIRVPNVFRAKNVAIGPSLIKALFDLVIVYRAIKLLKQNRYDVIHGIEEGGFLALMLARRFNTRAVFEKHSDPFSHRKGLIKNFILTLYASLEKYTVRRTDLVIGTGTGLAEQARQMQPKGEVAAIFDIPSSLVEANDADAKTRAAELKQSPDEQLVTFVGSFAVYQGIELLFDSIPEVLKQAPNARFLIIGGNETEIAERRQQLAMQGCDQQVSFLGKIPPDELPVSLAASDALLAPRQSGVNTPLKILDYFKAGRAIVATDVASNRLILNEATAVFATPTPAGYAASIAELLQNDALKKQLGENGKRMYQEKYNFHTFKRLIDEAYQTLKLN